ncbi:hypothetical protein [Cupriavidus basilensis]|uniref:hypothetical protein n=1 Tax=Cupriavidus basilensis TaxID=68895 RepID=UPI0005B9EA80|nr:hypothetical protein [Cupriavidus basilensis]
MRFTKILRWTFYVVVLVLLVCHIQNARLRATADHCTRHKSDNSAYVAEQCVIDHWKGLVTVRLRIFRNGEDTVLAERTYTADEKILNWDLNGKAVYYGVEASDGDSIALPPSRLDRLRAVLP